MDSGKKTINHVEIRKILPVQDGYRMPGEYEPHRGCILIWPERPGSWRNGAREAKKAFADVIRAIAKSEEVYLAASGKTFSEAEKLAQRLQTDEALYPIRVFTAETDDAWARDVGPTFVTDGQEVRGINWEFNAWGGTEDGLYASWEKDNRFAPFFCEKEGYTWYDARPFVLEGGSVHSDGEGTVMVTEEHVDNVCAFLKPGEVILAWTDNREDPQYPLSMACLGYLEGETDAKGRKITVHKLPIPDHPVCVTREELEGYVFEEGEDVREEGERLAASYVNFYFSNGAVVLPAFGGENEESDRRAAQILGKLCPDREIIPVYARDILTGGGNIHCITQQIPAGKRRNEQKR